MFLPLLPPWAWECIVATKLTKCCFKLNPSSITTITKAMQCQIHRILTTGQRLLVALDLLQMLNHLCTLAPLSKGLQQLFHHNINLQCSNHRINSNNFGAAICSLFRCLLNLVNHNNQTLNLVIFQCHSNHSNNMVILNPVHPCVVCGLNQMLLNQHHQLRLRHLLFSFHRLVPVSLHHL